MLHQRQKEEQGDLLKMFKQWKKRKEEKQKKLELAAKQNKYLIDCRGDIAFLQKMIELVNKDPDLTVQMVLIDGTQLNIRAPSQRASVNRESIWDR